MHDGDFSDDDTITNTSTHTSDDMDGDVNININVGPQCETNDPCGCNGCGCSPCGCHGGHNHHGHEKHGNNIHVHVNKRVINPGHPGPNFPVGYYDHQSHYGGHNHCAGHATGCGCGCTSDDTITTGEDTTAGEG